MERHHAEFFARQADLPSDSATWVNAVVRYIDSGLREADQTVAHWMSETLTAGVSEFRCQAGYFTLEGSSLLLPVLKKCAAEGHPSRS